MGNVKSRKADGGFEPPCLLSVPSVFGRLEVKVLYMTDTISRLGKVKIEDVAWRCQ